MSTSYTAIGWNKQKLNYDRLLAGFILFYLLICGGLTLLFNPQVTFETLIIRSTSTLAVLILHIILAIGPLCRINKMFLPFLYNRRHLGVTMFILATIHGVFSIIQFHALGNVSPLISLFTSNTNFNSLSAFPFQALGFAALVIFFLMAITSHDFWLHNLGPRIWKSLHMLVYMAYFLVIMHIILGVIEYERNPLFFIIVLTGSGTLIILHLIAGIQERKIDLKKHRLVEEGMIYACRSDEIKDNRAKIFSVNSERIAIYRFENKLYGIQNVCKHQGGPLGEGKIIDGCVTCPWHGYQYLPGNGQSPPPFKEKVATYSIKVVGKEVFVNPIPFPEGTALEGALIN